MSNHADYHANHCTPILNVSDFQNTVSYFTDKLGFELAWVWGDSPEFGAVRLDHVEIFLCLNGQGAPGTWLMVFMDDVDAYHDKIKQAGAEIVSGPESYPWGMREIGVKLPDDHVIRFGSNTESEEHHH